MKKNRVFLLSFWLLAASALHAQKQAPHGLPEPVNPQKDKVEYKGYTIRVLPTMGSGYGYDILKGRELIVHHNYNPFTMSPDGLREKMDVYKVAKWQIDHLNDNPVSVRFPGKGIQAPPSSKISQEILSSGVKTSHHTRASFNSQIPKAVAEELKIELNDIPKR